MHSSARCTILTLVVVAGISSSAGCAINAEPDFDSPVPQDRFLAIREAETSRDISALPDLIRQLGSDDPLVRVAAIDALETVTGETRGYTPHAREIERREAIGRWVSWLETQQEGVK